MPLVLVISLAGWLARLPARRLRTLERPIIDDEKDGNQLDEQDDDKGDGKLLSEPERGPLVADPRVSVTLINKWGPPIIIAEIAN